VDETDDVVHFEERQDVTEIVEDNKHFMNATDERARYGEFDRVASIPIGVFMELRKKGIVQDRKAFARWLDDPDNKVFRTRPGKLSK
jgi:hypothetical protein